MDRLIQLRSFFRQDPGNERLAVELLDALLAEGHVGEVESLLDGLPTAWQDQPDFLFRRGRCALSRGEFPAAVHSLRELLEKGADSIAVRHDLAFALLGDGQLTAAEQVLAPLLVYSVEEPSIGVLHARLLQHRRQYADAVLILEAIANSQPAHAEAWGLLAMLHLDMGNPERARGAAQRALALDPVQSDAWTALGTLGLWEHDAKSASEAFNQVLSRQPAAGRALAGAGESLMLTGDVEAARAFLERAVQHMPSHIGTWHALAWCELLQGDVVQAQTSFEQAMALDRNFGETHGGMALVLVLKGDIDEARQAIRRALGLDAQSRNARYAQSLMWRQEGRAREAATMVDGILAEAGVASSRRPVDFIEQLQRHLQPKGRT